MVFSNIDKYEFITPMQSLIKEQRYYFSMRNVLPSWLQREKNAH